ncbi:MAG: hypothetical protein WEA58_10810 [Balneolaceae bacterium]
MEKTKIDFIVELIDSKQFDGSNKERLFKLVSDELKQIDDTNNSVKSEVNLIKKKLESIISGDFIKSENGESVKIQDNVNNSKTIHNPQRVVDLLSKFSEKSTALKFTVHEWDIEVEYKNLSEFLKQVRKEYNEFSYELKELKEKLNGKCYGFLLNENIGKSGWGYDMIKAGWSSPELSKWCQKNPDKNPEECPLTIEDPNKKISITCFGDVIQHFKHEIEVREEGDKLKRLFIDVMRSSGLFNPFLGFNRPELINLDGKTFYTDVQWIKAAVDRIFKGIKKHQKHNPELADIAIEATETNEYVLIRIVHKNSFSQGASIEVNNKLTNIRGDFSTIKDRLHNLCDWSIESVFKEGAFRLNYLCMDEKIPFKEKIDDSKGFTHLLKFYKTSI